MTAFSSTFARLAVVGLVGFVLAQACSASSEDAGLLYQGGSSGTGGSGGVGGGKVYSPDVIVPPMEGGAGAFNPLCGVDLRNGCLPDDVRACSDYMPSPRPFELPAGGGASGASNQGGAGGAAGSAGDSGAGGEAGSAGAAGTNAGGVSGGGSSSTGADAGAGGVPGPPAYACRVVRAADQSVSECAPTGRGMTNAPCFTGADCGAGLGCVADGTVSRCRPYCCGGEGSCTKGSYCAERELKDSSTESATGRVWVPVCVPADNCELSEPYPCPSERVCQCASGTACMVVRPDGTTACTAPGAGELGDACPCAYGFVCSRGTATATCVKLCATGDDGDAGLGCTSGKCQGSAELPAGWGVCVGG
ncbi:MAG TPA: hypothetical protein VG937_04020 [Polyangiaceae bacterium]|jgi:hypothetical protein|nr:hypothetical protein [Polyangiaceae bacterium]